MTFKNMSYDARMMCIEQMMSKNMDLNDIALCCSLPVNEAHYWVCRWGGLSRSESSRISGFRK